MSKTKKSKYPPYSQARAQALDLQLNSRGQYLAWHKKTKCQYLPRYPERVYKEWLSWNDWLGTANVFRGDALRPARPFWEAVKWAQQYAADNDVNTMAEWFDRCDTDAENIPEDIPHRPDTRYDEWKQIGWRGWLGTDVRGRLMAAKMDTALMCICSYHTLTKPGNVYAVLNTETGEADLRGMLARDPRLRVVRAWRMEAECKDTVAGLLAAYGRNDGEGWFIPNVNSLVFELDNLLQPFLGS